MTDQRARNKAPRTPLQVMPLIIGPGNALAATGFLWSWCSAFWSARGRAFVGAGRKRGIPAQALLEELARGGADPELPSLAKIEPEPVDAAEAVRRAIGVSKRGGSRS